MLRLLEVLITSYPDLTQGLAGLPVGEKIRTEVWLQQDWFAKSGGTSKDGEVLNQHVYVGRWMHEVCVSLRTVRTWPES